MGRRGGGRIGGERIGRKNVKGGRKNGEEKDPLTFGVSFCDAGNKTQAS